MTAPRAFTTLLTEAIRKLAPQARRASNWRELLEVPKGYSRQEFDTYLRPMLEDAVDVDGDPRFTRDRLLEHMESSGPQSRMTVKTDRHSYRHNQRVDQNNGNLRTLLPEMFDPIPQSTRADIYSSTRPGPHSFDTDKSPDTVLPSWARMEDVITERGIREPMAVQLQSDLARHSDQVRRSARNRAATSGLPVEDEVDETVKRMRNIDRSLDEARRVGADNERDYLDKLTAEAQRLRQSELGFVEVPEQTATSAVDWHGRHWEERWSSPEAEERYNQLDRMQTEEHNAIVSRRKARIGGVFEEVGVPSSRVFKDADSFNTERIRTDWAGKHYRPSAWEANGGEAFYRPAIAVAIRDAVDRGHDRLLFPSADVLAHTTSDGMPAEAIAKNIKITETEVARILRAVGVEPEWEDASVRMIDPKGDRRMADYPGAAAYPAWRDSRIADERRIREEIMRGDRDYEFELTSRPDREYDDMNFADPDPSDAAFVNAETARHRERALEEAFNLNGLREREADTLLRGYNDDLPYLDDVYQRELAGQMPSNVTIGKTRALKLDKLKGKALPILSAAIMAGAGVAALPAGAEAQEAPQDPPQDPPVGATPATDSLIAAIRRGAGAPEIAPEGEDEGGIPWGLLGGTAAAIAAAALGGPALTRALTRAGPSAPPVPSRGLVRQLTTHAPVTHPTTPAQAQAIAAAQAERQVAVSRLRSLVDPIDPNDEAITRTVDQALANGPSYARQMKPVDSQIADIQESLVRHGLVTTSGTVHDVDLVRTARELVAKAGNEEFWLKDPDRVMSSPELLASAIAEHENMAAMAAAVNRSLDPNLSFEEQQFASRVADEFMQRAIGAAQRGRRDISETGRTLRAMRLLGDIYSKNGNNGQAWLAAAVRIAGTDLQAADASAIVRLAVSGQYSLAAKKLNMLRTAHPLDKLDEGLRSAMQLTFFRPFRDLISNLTNVADFAAAGRIAGIADIGLSVFSGKREVMPPGLATQLKVLGQGFATGGMDALRLLFRGKVADDMEFMRRVAERMDFTNETTFTHPVTHALATQARRWFTSADYPAYRMAFNDALADMSMVAAYKAGHRGAKLGPAAMDLFEHPGPALTIKAQQEAIERVWQNRNVLSTATHSFMSNSSPATRFMARRVMPFVHTASAQIGQALNQSPVGYFKTAADLGRFVLAGLDKTEKGEAQRKLARRLGLHATGLGWMSLGYYLADNDMIQGAFSDDSRAQDAQEELNQRPMTIKHNGKWYAASILLGPQAMLMAMGAGLHRGLKNMAEMEAADPEMEQRWGQSIWAATKPMGDEVLGAMNDLPLADGIQNVSKFVGDYRKGTGGQATGGLLGRIATQPIPAFLQQYAETQDLDADGDVVRRDTRGSNFSEAFSNTVREATPFGPRQTVPVRATPMGFDGKGIHVGDSPFTSLINPLRNQYQPQEDWVTEALVEHDAFPAHQGRHEGESQEAYNRRRMAEGEEEYEALANALDNKWENGLEFADQKLLVKWHNDGEPIPSPDYTALLRSVSAGLRRERTAERNKLKKAAEEKAAREAARR